MGRALLRALRPLREVLVTLHNPAVSCVASDTAQRLSAENFSSFFVSPAFVSGKVKTPRLIGKLSVHQQHALAATTTLGRSLSSNAQGSETLAELAETNRLRFVKYLVLFMMVALGVKVLPSLGQNSLQHALTLTGSPQPFWQKSGLARLRALAESDSSAEKLVEAGAPSLLTRVLEDSKDAETTEAALLAIQELSRLHSAREAFVLVGLTDVLQGIVLQQQGGRSKELAQQLSVQLLVQQHHVE